MGEGSFLTPWSDKQVEILLWIPRVSAILSFFGCCYIIQHVLCSKQRRGRVYHRILLGMSIVDVFNSALEATREYLLPSDSPYYDGGIGNDMTCRVSGFLTQGLFLTSIYYNGMLTYFFFLSIRRGWREHKLKTRVEPWMHVLPHTLGWASAFVGIPLDLYNPTLVGCWIAAHPPGCQETYNAKGNEPTCIRGDNASLYRWLLLWLSVWGVFFYSAAALFFIYRGIRKAEQKSGSYDFEFQHYPSSTADGLSSVTSTQPRRRSHSKAPTNSQRFATQALLYCIFFFLAFSSGTINATLSSLDRRLFFAIFHPAIQPFFNFLIYVRPRYRRWRKDNPDRCNPCRWLHRLVCGRCCGVDNSAEKDPQTRGRADSNLEAEAPTEEKALDETDEEPRKAARETLCEKWGAEEMKEEEEDEIMEEENYLE